MSYRAIHAYPWDLADEGVAAVVDEVRALGIDTITLAGSDIVDAQAVTAAVAAASAALGHFVPRTPFVTGFRLRQSYGETSPKRLRREGGRSRGPCAPLRSPGSLAGRAFALFLR